MQQRLMFLIGACLLANGVVSAALAEPRAIPGSRVTLEAPADFVTTDRFAGLISSKLGISIVVMDVPAVGYDQMAIGLTPDVLATRGVLSAKIGTLEGRPQPHVFITAEQGGTVDKFLLLTKNGAHGTLVTINVPNASLTGWAIVPIATDRKISSICAREICPVVRDALGTLIVINVPCAPSLVSSKNLSTVPPCSAVMNTCGCGRPSRKPILADMTPRVASASGVKPIAIWS